MSTLHETPNGLKLSNDLLEMEIMGGIKLDGLDRMRVTLKLSLPDSPRPPFRHTLDLYNDTQLEKFTRFAVAVLLRFQIHRICDPVLNQ